MTVKTTSAYALINKALLNEKLNPQFSAKLPFDLPLQKIIKNIKIDNFT